MFFTYTMRNSLTQEVSVSIILILLLALLLNPWDFWMPSPVQMMLIVALVVAFVVFAVFIWKEHPRDEREDLHRMIANQTALLAVAATLVLGIVIQSLHHKIDTWLVLTLGVLVLAKICGLVYSRIKH